MVETLRTRASRSQGFTLIELLIVVAIIAILAAIAVPNFLEAQTRSKVSRVLGELRSLRTAIEAYSVDYNKPPRHSWGAAVPGYNPPGGDRITIGGAGNNFPHFQNLTNAITTPVAYISTFTFEDPFVASKDALRPDWRLYTYEALWAWEKLLNTPSASARGTLTPDEVDGFRQDLGSYYLLSIGPSGNPSLFYPFATAFGQQSWFTQYDPTNGTISQGTIYVSQRHSSPVQRPYP